MDTDQSFLPSVDLLTTEAFAILRKRAKPLLAVAALMFCIIGALVVFPVAFFTSVLSVSFVFSGSSINIGLVILIAGFVLVATFVSVILQNWATLALMIIIKQPSIFAVDAIRQAWGYVGKYIWTSLIAGLVCFGGFLVFGIVGFIFMIWFAFVGWIVLTKDKVGTEALITSRELVKGRFIAVAVRLAVPVIVFMVILIGLDILQTLISPQLVKDGVLVLSSVISLVFTPFFLAYTWLVYSSIAMTQDDKAIDFSGRRKLKYSVFAILAILVMVAGALVFVFAGPKLLASLNTVNDTKRRADQQIIMLALRQYRDGVGRGTEFPATLDELVPMYLKSVPTDPQTHQPYEYKTTFANRTFTLCVVLQSNERKCENSLKLDSRSPYNTQESGSI